MYGEGQGKAMAGLEMPDFMTYHLKNEGAGELVARYCATKMSDEIVARNR